jgi:hypothetical protein
MIEPKNNFTWNLTDSMDWKQVAYWTDVFTSPHGRLYGIQEYNNGIGSISAGYEFDFVKG